MTPIETLAAAKVAAPLCIAAYIFVWFVAPRLARVWRKR